MNNCKDQMRKRGERAADTGSNKIKCEISEGGRQTIEHIKCESQELK